MINIDAVLKNADWPKRTPDVFFGAKRVLGGPGSGDFGHSGRPGEVGGSGGGSSSAQTLFDAARALDKATSDAEVHQIRDQVKTGIRDIAEVRRESIRSGDATPRPVDAFPGRTDVYRAFQHTADFEEVDTLEGKLIRGLEIAVTDRLTRHAKKEKTK